MAEQGGQRDYGLGRGKVYPAADASSLLHPLRRLVQSSRRTVAAMGLRDTDRVLEVGCGPGYFTPVVASARSSPATGPTSTST
jgi:ubiquinone/menaquinone biosynthesis C-methylase UbiE